MAPRCGLPSFSSGGCAWLSWAHSVSIRPASGWACPGLTSLPSLSELLGHNLPALYARLREWPQLTSQTSATDDKSYDKTNSRRNRQAGGGGAQGSHQCCSALQCGERSEVTQLERAAGRSWTDSAMNFPNPSLSRSHPC